MRYVGWGLWIKPDICFADILTVCDLIRAAHNQSWRIRIPHYRMVVKTLTTGRKVRWFDFFLVLKVLKAADMLSDEKVEYDPEKQILHFVNWLAPRLRVPAREILTQYNTKTLEGFYRESLEFHFKRDMLSALAQHAPVKFGEMVEQLYDYRRADAREARYAEIAETILNPDDTQIEHLTNRLGFDGGSYE